MLAFKKKLEFERKLLKRFIKAPYVFQSVVLLAKLKLRYFTNVSAKMLQKYTTFSKTTDSKDDLQNKINKINYLY